MMLQRSEVETIILHLTTVLEFQSWIAPLLADQAAKSRIPTIIWCSLFKDKSVSYLKWFNATISDDILCS